MDLRYFSTITFRERKDGSFSISGRSITGLILFSLALLFFVHVWLLLPPELLQQSSAQFYLLEFGIVFISLALIFGLSFQIHLNTDQFRVQQKFLGIPYKSINIPMSTLLNDNKSWKNDSLFFSKHVHLDYGLWDEDDDYIEIKYGKKCLEVGTDKTSETIMRHILEAMKTIKTRNLSR